MWKQLFAAKGKPPGSLIDILTPPRAQSLIKLNSGDIQKWRTYDDKELGGFSNCTFTSTQNQAAAFQGVTSTRIDEQRAPYSAEYRKKATKTGFCAIRLDVQHEKWELEEFHGLKFVLKPDSRNYIFNVRTLGMVGHDYNEDLFQAHIPRASRPGMWNEIFIPFCDFNLTNRGIVQPNESMNLNTITEVGFLIADLQSGPFELQIESIEAFRYQEEDKKFGVDVDRILERNEELGYAGE